MKKTAHSAVGGCVAVGGRGRLQSSASRRRRPWDISLALALQEGLRSGDVFVPDSRRQVSFGTFGYDELAWQARRESAFDTLGLPTEGATAVHALVQASHKTAAKTAQSVAANRLARMEGGRLRWRRDPRYIAPERTAALRQEVRGDRARVRMAHLLMEIDALCRCAQYLTPPMAEASPWDGEAPCILTPERHDGALRAALVAHGTNLSLSAMAESPEDLTVRMLPHVSRTGVRTETIRRANAAIVNSHRALAIRQCWSKGQVRLLTVSALGDAAGHCWPLFIPATLALMTEPCVSTSISQINTMCAIPRWAQ